VPLWARSLFITDSPVSHSSHLNLVSLTTDDIRDSAFCACAAAAQRQKASEDSICVPTTKDSSETNCTVIRVATSIKVGGVV